MYVYESIRFRAYTTLISRVAVYLEQTFFFFSFLFSFSTTITMQRGIAGEERRERERERII